MELNSTDVMNISYSWKDEIWKYRMTRSVGLDTYLYTADIVTSIEKEDVNEVGVKLDAGGQAGLKLGGVGGKMKLIALDLFEGKLTDEKGKNGSSVNYIGKDGKAKISSNISAGLGLLGVGISGAWTLDAYNGTNGFIHGPKKNGPHSLTFDLTVIANTEFTIWENHGFTVSEFDNSGFRYTNKLKEQYKTNLSYGIGGALVFGVSLKYKNKTKTTTRVAEKRNFNRKENLIKQ